MQITHPPDRQVPDLLATAQTYQDNIIGKRLPAWLLSASAAQLTDLGDATRHSLVLRQQLSEALAGIQSLDSFALSALQTALQARYGDGFNVQHWVFITGHREPVINSQPVGVHLTEVVYGQVPLVEAALRNFTDAETKPAGQPKGNRLLHTREGEITPPGAIEFAQLCRDLDVGGQYQRHLDSVLQPDTGTEADKARAAKVRGLLANSHRYTLLIDAYEARLKGVLSEPEFQLVAGLATTDSLGRLEGALSLPNS